MKRWKNWGNILFFDQNKWNVKHRPEMFELNFFYFLRWPESGLLAKIADTVMLLNKKKLR